PWSISISTSCRTSFTKVCDRVSVATRGHWTHFSCRTLTQRNAGTDKGEQHGRNSTLPQGTGRRHLPGLPARRHGVPRRPGVAVPERVPEHPDARAVPPRAIGDACRSRARPHRLLLLR